MDRSRCLISGSSKLKLYDIERPTRHYDVRICRRCRYVSNADNTLDYTKFQSPDEFELTPRVGTDDHPGREFHMAKMGAEILKRERRPSWSSAPGQPGLPAIAKLPSVNKVIMSDIVDVRGEADFINITDGTDQRFDLIIACEVVEHFIDPRNEFPGCSTCSHRTVYWSAPRTSTTAGTRIWTPTSTSQVTRRTTARARSA